MSKKWKTEFNGKEVEIETVAVSNRIRRESEKFANEAFQHAVQEKFILQIQAEEILRNLGFTPESELAKLENLSVELKANEVVLLSGRRVGEKLTKFQGREVAMTMRKIREQIDALNAARASVYARTAEKYAEDERFDYYVYACTTNASTGRPFFKSFEDYKDNKDAAIVVEAYRAFITASIGESILDGPKADPEIKWLIKYGFMDDKLNFINSNGHLVDEEMRLINDKGHYVDENENRVDRWGNKIDENGQLIVDSSDAYKD